MPGVALERDGEMVLEVEAPDDPNPFVVIGKTRDGFFEGKHEGLRGDDVSVWAKWTRLDDRFIGTWSQDGVEWLFAFSVPSSLNSGIA